ncbi:MBL fold metallo-hydrolase [Lachnoclostridium sp. An76]|uniref:MBL fold metallo-hydrolase n=1 Tax=Lachnoclostridium sp. An76 TaxID=1965654 RepID=UPI000B37CE6F|nr:MBL fold metallo-hydrolase [Lachnoclostridium sp. An76]OUN33468.1 MBL fold metallo-hydrolase [Lachnoclostridium sp. An76]
MKVGKFVLGPVATNCYIGINEETKECFIVDPATCPPEFVSYIKNAGLTVKAVLLTHGHFDHIMGLDALLKEFPVPVYAHEAERDVLESEQLNSSASMLGQPYSFSGADYVTNRQELRIAGFEIRVVYTPGHTIGGCCYYIEKEKTLFSGDTLFHGSVGRTDLPTGSMGQLVSSVRDRLFVLPDDTKVYPGHMEETTIGYEKKYNPFI